MLAKFYHNTLPKKGVLRQTVRYHDESKYGRFMSTKRISNYDEDCGDKPLLLQEERNHSPAIDKERTMYNAETKPRIFNSKEDAADYLGKILNAKVYEAAIPTKLQRAVNLSAVSKSSLFLLCLF